MPAHLARANGQDRLYLITAAVVNPLIVVSLLENMGVL